MVDVLGGGEEIEVEAGAAFAIDIDGIALVDTPGDVIGFPAEAFVAKGELHGGTGGVCRASGLDGGLVAIGDGDDARLGGGEIDLEDEFVEFAAELVRVREQGWALDNQENEIEGRCIGAPITGPGGVVVAALSISGRSFAWTWDGRSPWCRD